jgi:hypothetical protein
MPDTGSKYMEFLSTVENMQPRVQQPFYATRSMVRVEHQPIDGSCTTTLDASRVLKPMILAAGGRTHFSSSEASFRFRVS